MTSRTVGDRRRPSPTTPGLGATIGGALAWLLLACAPIVREPDTPGARERVTGASLLGPYDGQVIDANTAEPLADATVVAIWQYDRGRGLTSSAGAKIEVFTTDAAGRYKIPATQPERAIGIHRLVDFDLIIYKRGYVGYRSDHDFDGNRRPDFVQRHHRISLRKWRETDSHADHLAFLRAPGELEPQLSWERTEANADLLRRAGDAGDEAGSDLATGAVAPEDSSSAIDLLDATALLPPAEVKRRTGSATIFRVKELSDLTRTHFYHGVHLEAATEGEDWDVAYRVWKAPPAGLEAVQETFEASLPGVPPSSEIIDPTWVYDGDDVRAVAFLDRERDLGVLLTCGPSQCVDIETALILAKYIYTHLDQLGTEPAPAAEASP